MQADLDEWKAWGARDYFRTVSRDQADADNPVCEEGVRGQGVTVGRALRNALSNVEGQGEGPR